MQGISSSPHAAWAFRHFGGSLDRRQAPYDTMQPRSAGRALKPSLCEPRGAPVKDPMSRAIGEHQLSAADRSRSAQTKAAGERSLGLKPDYALNPFRFATHEKAIAGGEPYTHTAFGHLKPWGTAARLPSMNSTRGISISPGLRRQAATTVPLALRDAGMSEFVSRGRMSLTSHRCDESFRPQRELAKPKPPSSALFWGWYS